MNQPTNPLSQREQADAPGGRHMQRVERLISNLLRVGVAASVILIATGTIVAWTAHRESARTPDALSALVRPSTAAPHSLRGVVAGLRRFRGQALVALGLIVLIATPMMRVAISVVALLQERDWLYASIASAVFCLLLLSLVLGAVE